MPRPKGKSSSLTGAGSKSQGVAGFFRPIFAANKKLLKTRSNKQVLAMWLAANPSYKEVPDNVKSGLANLKSNMRSNMRKRQSKKAAMEVALDTAMAKSKTSPPLSSEAADTGLERLEMLIDECLTLARNLDRKGPLHNVVIALRIARSRVVWKTWGVLAQIGDGAVSILLLKGDARFNERDVCRWRLHGGVG